MTILRRRWKLMLTVWLAVAIPLVTFVWLHFESEYESVGVIRVAPYIPRILFRDEDSGLLPLYGAFVTTQIQLITNPTVLTQALQTPEVKNLPWTVSVPDPVAYLAEKLEVTNPPNTELINLSMQGRDPKGLAPIVNAVLKAYMEAVVEEDQQDDRAKLDLLYRKQSDLETDLKNRHNELYEMANIFGTASLGSRQDTAFECLQELQIQLRKAQVTRVTAQARLETLKSRPVPSATTNELEQLEQEQLDTDQELASLIQAKVRADQDYADLSQQFGSQHPNLASLQHKREDLQARIHQRQRAIAKSVQILAIQKAQKMIHDELREVEERLAEAAQTEKALQKVVDEELDKITHMGRNAVQLEALREKAEQSKQLYDAVLQRIQHIEVERQRPARVTIASQAREPKYAARDKRPKLTVVSIMGALFLATLLGIFMDSHDTSVHCENDVQRHLGIPVLGKRSLTDHLGSLKHADDASIAEEIRSLRGSVLFANGSNGYCSVLVTSPNPKEGKTRMAGELAQTLAESGRKVLLIDADNRKQDLTKQFGHENQPGLAGLLANGSDLTGLLQPTNTNGLVFLPSGPYCEMFSELLVRPGTLERIRRSFNDYDHVIIDSPPALLSNESGIWARHMDATILVLRADRSTREEATAAKTCLTQMGGRIIGAILNGIDPRNLHYRQCYKRQYEVTLNQS